MLHSMKSRFVIRTLFSIALGMSLAACGPHEISVKPADTFPKPLVEPLPARVGVFFPADFASFAHHEERPNKGGEWTISLGATQVQVFRTVLSSMFTEFQELTSEQASAGLSAVIVPRVQEFQFALPADTRSNVFEIWVKYDLSIRDTQGDEVGHWVFTAYGKTPTAFMKSGEEAIQAATLVALRDAGASMISGMERDARIREWLGVPAEQAPAEQAPEASSEAAFDSALPAATNSPEE
jgi:hypothetical protein